MDLNGLALLAKCCIHAAPNIASIVCATKDA
ncbi:unnamed protein product [Ectocarpus sp. CCAP 1310/34]|nr:unnamed protein product [Ectocarpus sp. CCAP 1310/34]